MGFRVEGRNSVGRSDGGFRTLRLAPHSLRCAAAHVGLPMDKISIIRDSPEAGFALSLSGPPSSTAANWRFPAQISSVPAREATTSHSPSYVFCLGSLCAALRSRGRASQTARSSTHHHAAELRLEEVLEGA